MNYKPSFTEISSNEIQSWVNYGNPGETTKKKSPNCGLGFFFCGVGTVGLEPTTPAL